MTNETDYGDKQPKHILKLTIKEKREFLASFDRVFADVDGVVWTLGGEIVGAPQGFQALKDAGKQLNFISNNSVRTWKGFEQKFKAVNMDVDESELVHPADSIVDYLQSIKFEGLIYVIACERLKNRIREAGYQLIDGPTNALEESYENLAAHIFGGELVRAVVFDIDINLNWAKMLRAQIFLQHPECILIAGATDTMLPATKDVGIIGPGPFQKLLADVCNKRLVALGKPGKDLVKILVRRFNIPQTQRVLMIGDMLEQDVSFGKACGFQTLLVLSGGCTLSDLKAETNAERIPDYYAESAADFVELIKDVNEANTSSDVL